MALQGVATASCRGEIGRRRRARAHPARTRDRACWSWPKTCFTWSAKDTRCTRRITTARMGAPVTGATTARTAWTATGRELRFCAAIDRSSPRSVIAPTCSESGPRPRRRPTGFARVSSAPRAPEPAVHRSAPPRPPVGVLHLPGADNPPEVPIVLGRGGSRHRGRRLRVRPRGRRPLPPRSPCAWVAARTRASEILDGLAPGDRDVAEGAFVLKSAALSGELSAHEHAH